MMAKRNSPSEFTPEPICLYTLAHLNDISEVLKLQHDIGDWFDLAKTIVWDEERGWMDEWLVF